MRHLRHLKELDRASKTFQVLKVKIPPLKKKFVIPGKGMPKYIKKTSIVELPVEYGDLVVNVCVNYPEKVNEAQIEVLSKFLPPPSVMEVENTGKSSIYTAIRSRSKIWKFDLHRNKAKLEHLQVLFEPK